MNWQPLLLAPLLLCAGLPAGAETIEIPIGQQGGEKRDIDRPEKGMNKRQVEAVFGKPMDWKEAVGEPPISSWVYEDYVVYFEFDHVIHTVLKHHARVDIDQQ